MDIKKLTEILQRCAENESVDELLQAAGFDDSDIPEGESVKIRLTISKENGDMHVKVLRENVPVEDMTLEELEDYYDDLEDEYLELQGEEPEDSESDEYFEWEEAMDYLEDEMSDVEDKIDELKGDEDGE